MAKTLYFKWLSSININEISNGIESNSYLNIVNVNTFKSLDQLVKAAKKLDFIDAERLVVDLMLKGVFETIEKALPSY